MDLQQLTQPWSTTRRLGRPAEVTGVTPDSRRVEPGFVFVAIRGFQRDGHEFIPEALRRGAVAVVYEDPAAAALIPPEITAVPAPNSRRALAELAARVWGDPSADLTLVGVTGTNGKTTVAALVEALGRAAGRTTGLIGTLGARVAGEELPGTHTTPDAAELQALLARMRGAGADLVSMEVSSHGLAQDRVWGCHFAVAIFTNLTQDHLDFHLDAEDYYLAKRRLFTEYADLAAPGRPLVGVINVDDPTGQRLAGESRCRVITYALDTPAQVRGRDLVSTPSGLRLSVDWPGGEPLELRLQLLGRFNACNALAAVAAGHALGQPGEVIRLALEGLAAVPGRFEKVDLGRDFTVVVDYAHTPDAVRNVLEAARALQPRRLICLLGCGGDRDRGKRPQMARIATSLADYTFLTSDNPRTEDPQAILQEMLAGAAGNSFEVISDRREAIFSAVRRCEAGDLLVLAGKGHETYQEIMGERFPFDDREVAREALRERLGE